MTTIRKNIELGDPKYFCNKSWTVSYHVNAKAWISFHSYLPNFYIAENNFFYSGINGCCDDLDFIVGVIENPIDCSLEGTAKDVTICQSYGYGVSTYYCDTCLISGNGGIINDQPLTVGKWYYNARIGEKLYIDSDYGCQSNIPTDFILDTDQQDNCVDIICPVILDCSLEGFIENVTSCTTLGRASNFDILAHANITNTGATVIPNNLGLYPGTSVVGFPPGIVNGIQHITDTTASNAKDDATAAFICLGALTPTGSVLADIGGTTITPGVYSVSSSLTITGTVTLDGEGDPDAIFVFQIPTTFLPTSSTIVSLINNAQPCNVYWVTGSSATLDTGANVVGNIIANISVTFDTGASLTGKAFALTGSVTLDTNIITECQCTINPCSISTTTTTSTSIISSSTTTTTTTVYLCNINIDITLIDFSTTTTTTTIL